MLSELPLIRIPLWPLSAITLPPFKTAVPIMVFDAPLSISIPWLPLPSATVPAEVVPM